MMSKLYLLLDKLLPNIFNTFVSFGIVAICSFFIYFFFFRNEESKKHKKIIIKRFIYLMLMIDACILAKIWVEGFAHIFTMLSLVAAGIVVTNKESIMNLVGAMIINWRALFVEGDFIQIQNFSGYVSTIGFMYFRIYETVSIDQAQATGRTIKIPNNLVITAPVINFSPESNLYLYKIVCNIQKDILLDEQLKKIEKVMTDILDNHYADNIYYNTAYLKSHNRDLALLVELRPSIELNYCADKYEELKIIVRFYCFSRDYHQISQQFWLRLLSKGENP